ncbi:uncharacterized protein ACR2FA_007589 [Aphomia sociella]
MTMLLFIVTMAVIAMEAVRSQCLENANCDLGYYCDESYLCQQCIYCKNDIITRTCHKSIADCEFSSWNTSTTILTEGKENYNGSTRYIAIIVIAGVVAIILIGVFIFYRTVGKPFIPVCKRFFIDLINFYCLRIFLDRRVCQEMMLSPTAPPPYNLTSPLDEQYSICNNNSEISPLNKVNAESMEDARRQSANFQRANPFQPPYYIRKPPTPSNEPSNPSNANAHVNANAQEASGNNHSTVNDESSSPSNGFVYLDEETRASTWMPGDNNNNVNDESSSPSNGFVYLDEETRASTWMPGDNNNNVKSDTLQSNTVPARLLRAAPPPCP